MFLCGAKKVYNSLIFHIWPRNKAEKGRAKGLVWVGLIPTFIEYHIIDRHNICDVKFKPAVVYFFVEFYNANDSNLPACLHTS